MARRSNLSTFSVVIMFACAAPAPRIGSAAGPPGSAVGQAEYAIRWSVKDGGPKSASATLDTLDLQKDDSDTYEVQYYEVSTPPDAPTGFAPILRQRTKKKKTQLTFKYRGPDRLPQSPTLSDWKCPLPSASEKKDEADVSFLPSHKTKKVYSRSCTVENDDGPIAIPNSLGAKPKGCKNTMVRLKSGPLKVEEWHLANGGTVIEVSRSGKDSDADLADFQRKVVDVLQKKGITPLEVSKSEIGSECP